MLLEDRDRSYSGHCQCMGGRPQRGRKQLVKYGRPATSDFGIREGDYQGNGFTWHIFDRGKALIVPAEI